MDAPVVVSPVNDTLATRRSATSASPMTPPGPGSTLTHSGGTPASTSRSPSMRAVMGRERGRLEDDGVAGRERRGHLPAGDHQREVPRDDQGADARPAPGAPRRGRRPARAPPSRGACWRRRRRTRRWRRPRPPPSGRRRWGGPRCGTRPRRTARCARGGGRRPAPAPGRGRWPTCGARARRRTPGWRPAGPRRRRPRPPWRRRPTRRPWPGRWCRTWRPRRHRIAHRRRGEVRARRPPDRLGWVAAPGRSAGPLRGPVAHGSLWARHHTAHVLVPGQVTTWGTGVTPTARLSRRTRWDAWTARSR